MKKHYFPNFQKIILTVLFSLVLFSGTQCEDPSQTFSEDKLTVEDIHQIRILSREALSYMPDLAEWDTLMQTYTDSLAQEAFVLMFVERDILYKLGHTQLSEEEFNQNLQRYAATSEEIERIIQKRGNALAFKQIPIRLLSSYPFNYVISRSV